jgi:DNA-binding NtrC family response regulator
LSALEEFRKNPRMFSLLVTDQSMPFMNGTELAGMMKALNPDLSVIIITGFADNLSEEELLRSGISEVVLKPMRMDDFSKAIRKVLDSNKIKTQ